jgi:hypothetical protein
MSLNYWADAVLTGFGVLIFITGLIMYLVYGYQRTKIWPSRFWPSVVGAITASAVEQPNPRKKAAYAAVVRYSYRVGGRDYECGRIFWGPNEGTKEEMAEIVAGYPVGKDVWVQHDRTNPANAVLEPEKNTGLTPGVFYYGLVMMVLGFCAVGGRLYLLSH